MSMFNLFNRQNPTQDDDFGRLYSALTDDILEDDEPEVEPTASPVVTVVQTNTTKISVRADGVNFEVEQTETTVTTAPFEAFLESDESEFDEEEELEGVYFVDVELVDTYATRYILTAAIAEYCATNYANAEVVNRDGSVVTVRFTSPLRSAIAKMAIVAGVDEDNIAWMLL